MGKIEEKANIQVKIGMDNDHKVKITLSDDIGRERVIRFDYPKRKYTRFNQKISDFIYRRVERLAEYLDDLEENGGLTQLADVKEGSFVSTSGIHWVVLDHSFKSANGETGTLLIMYDEWRGGFFSEKGGSGFSNWATSTQRDDINGNLLSKLDRYIGVDFLMPMTRDLVSDDGKHGHGTCIDYVTIISKEEFNTYKDLIPYTEVPWWTLTPHYVDKDDIMWKIGGIHNGLHDSCCTVRASDRNSTMHVSDFGNTYGLAENYPLILLPNDFLVEEIEKPEKREYLHIYL